MATAPEVKDKIEIGTVLHRAFETLGSHFPQYFVMGILLVGLPSFILQWLVLDAVTNASVTTVSPLAIFTPAYFGSMIIVFLGGCLLQAVVVRSSIRYFGGLPASINSSLANAFRFVLPIIGVTILTMILTWIGMILLIVPGIIVYLMLSVSIPALIAERGGVIESMKRSRELTKGSRWRILLLLILFGIVYAVVLGIFSALAGMLAAGNALLLALVQGFSSVVTGVLMAAIIAALYYELRTVKEGATREGLATIFA